ncbi:MAG TPA: 2-iminoacetate synthase ThiH [Bacteroidales bacterium]|nr:2-iminoacetate synthase ThiH [Bacteroidales bacterium]
METFYDVHRQYDWEEVKASILAKTEQDVLVALGKPYRNIEDFKALVSPAAERHLEEMAKLSQQLTQKRFGKTIQFYVPLYLSNDCTNQCVYCGFNSNNRVGRVTLNHDQIIEEINAIKALGFEHILLVTGEHPKNCGFKYLKEAIRLIRPHFHCISAEVAPMSTEEYRTMYEEGLYAVYIYQETYSQTRYPEYHPGGVKANFRYRLETPDRLGMAGIHKIGLGCLLGLEDWRTEGFFAAMHIRYLEKKYWKSKYSISFPRLRHFPGSFEPNYLVTDRNLLQLILAFRIFDQELELSLSTRETPVFRDNVFSLGITLMSAGSKTVPGGYAKQISEVEQFAVIDNRPAQVVREAIEKQGYEVIWKDWDQSLQFNFLNHAH